MFLYLRMLVIMGVNLYTVREFLHVLGVVDYGIYNIVGSLVLMFSFLNNTLSTSSQRYFSIELSKGDSASLNRWFCLNISTFALFAGVIIFLAETIGLWFLNTHLTIPDDRLFAANTVFQISLVTFAAHMISIPYNALIVAHEKMGAFAYISIVEAFSKLLIAFILPYVPFDKLITYGLFLMLSGVAISATYMIYCLRRFPESKYSFYWNNKEAKELFSFSGWHLLGTTSMSIRSQGINILINMFFSPAVNASRAVAFQVNSAINQLSANFFTAVKPQIYKLYAVGEKEELVKLLHCSTIMSIFLVSLIIIPVLTNTEYVLSLWLKEIPEYVVIFTQLVLINGMIDSTNGPTIAAALATGKIKKYEIVVSVLIFMNLPCSYIALKLGAEPTATMIVSILLSSVSALVRVWLLKELIGVKFYSYFKVFVRLFLASVILLTIGNFLWGGQAESIMQFFVIAFAAAIMQIFTYYFLVLTQDDRFIITKLIKKQIRK